MLDPVIVRLRICPGERKTQAHTKYLYTNVHSSFTGNTPNWGPPCPSKGTWLMVMYPQQGTELNNKKEQAI